MLDKELFDAVKEGDIAKVKNLLIRGANVNAKDKDGRTPLHHAATIGHVEIARFLLERGANVNAKDKDGRTPLHHAATIGHVEIARFLLERGANVNAKGKNGNTPLHYAVRNGHVEVVNLLLENGANPEIKGEFGDTPLDLASGQVREVIEDFMSRPVMIIGLDYSELIAGKWGEIRVKVKGSGSVSLKLEGDLDYVVPEESRLSGISSIRVFVKPRTIGELPLKVVVESSGVKDSKIFLLKVDKFAVKEVEKELKPPQPPPPPEPEHAPLEKVGKVDKLVREGSVKEWIDLTIAVNYKTSM